MLEWTYNSNAIEGNTLILKVTKVVLGGITIGGKSMREHFEAINHKEAISFVESVVAGEEPFSERQIQCIHQLVLKNIDDVNAGAYRQQNVLISGAEHRPPNHILIAEQMSTLMDWYSGFAGHSIERAVRLHVDFVKIHPFIDGNGRTARLLMNFELLKAGYLPVVIKTSNRLAYYESLDLACVHQDYSMFLDQVLSLEESALADVISLASQH